MESSSKKYVLHQWSWWFFTIQILKKKIEEFGIFPLKTQKKNNVECFCVEQWWFDGREIKKINWDFFLKFNVYVYFFQVKFDCFCVEERVLLKIVILNYTDGISISICCLDWLKNWAKD